MRDGVSAKLALTTEAPMVLAVLLVFALLAPRTAAVSSGEVFVRPGDDLDTVAQSSPEGTRIILTAGEYRMQSIRPRRGQSFIGEVDSRTGRPLAVLNGSRLLTEFEREGRLFVARGQRQQGQARGSCRPDWPRCMFPEDLFFDGVSLKHVASKNAVVPGTFFFDYDADAIYIAEDPTGHKVETSVLAVAFHPSASGVTIRNLVVEKYATPAGSGAILAGVGWLVAGNEIRWNHGGGIWLGSDSRAVGNHVHHNGQAGVFSNSSVGAVFEENEIAFNGGLGFSAGWECGGSKFVRTRALVVRRNWVHDNYCAGLWTDGYNLETTYEGNVVENNETFGILHEISYAATIIGNTVRRNGSAGIAISNSRNVRVLGNEVIVGAGRGDGIVIIHAQRRDMGGPYGLLEARDNLVEGNVVVHEGRAGVSGLRASVDRERIGGWNNRFVRNRYVVREAGVLHWIWLRQMSFEEFVQANEDSGSTLEVRGRP